MGWVEELLARVRAEPVDRVALTHVVQSLWPDARVADVEPLLGGVGSLLHRVRLADAAIDAVVLRQLLVELGDDAATIRREVAAHTGLAASGLPVPAVHWHDADGDVFGRPAALLTLAPGRPLILELETPEAQRAFAAVLHAIHAVRPARMDGLPTLRTLDEHITRFGPPDVQSDVVDAVALTAAVDDRRDLVIASESVVHCDLHGGNVLWDGEHVTAVLDWPGAAIGAPGFDEAYAWLDTCLAHGRAAGDGLQRAVDDTRAGAPEPPAARALWRLVALQRALPSPSTWTTAYRATGIEIDDATVEQRFVALVEEALAGG